MKDRREQHMISHYLRSNACALFHFDGHTNFKKMQDMIDDAVLRPGRLEVHVEVSKLTSKLTHSNVFHVFVSVVDGAGSLVQTIHPWEKSSGGRVLGVAGFFHRWLANQTDGCCGRLYVCVLGVGHILHNTTQERHPSHHQTYKPTYNTNEHRPTRTHACTKRYSQPSSNRHT